jgi:hypothetical protein
MFIINADRSGWQPVFKQISSGIGNGNVYNATVKGNNSGISYSFPITSSSDGGQFYGTFGNPSMTKPDPILFVQDSALSIKIQQGPSTGTDGGSALPVMSDLALWFDGADPLGNGSIPKPGTNIATLADKSGKTYNATAQRGGGSFVAGGGIGLGGGYYTLNAPYSQTNTLFIVATGYNNNTIGGGAYYYNFDRTNSGSIIINSDAGWESPLSLFDNTNGITGQFIKGNTLTRPFIASVLQVPGRGVFGNFNGDRVISKSPYTAGAASAITVLGAALPGGDSALQGGQVIYEFILYNKALSETEIQMVEGYLACKWKLQSKLPPTSPFANTCPAPPPNAMTAPKGETRELWINPNIDTCEILAVLTGASYTQSYTAMALYKGQLMIGLPSNEKGYTFFSGGKINIGQWSHIVHVYSEKGGVHEIYINGAGPVTISGVTRANPSGYIGYSVGGGSKVNPLYQNTPIAMPFQGQIGAFRVYNRLFAITDVQNNLAATITTYINNQVELATKNDPNALAMAAGKFYVPMLGNSINYQPSPQ